MVTTVKTEIKPSAYQEQVMSHFDVQSPTNLMVEAVAGAGKTSLCAMLARRLSTRKNSSIIYLAFNREIVQEVTPKFEPLGVPVKTFHGWAMSALTRSFGRLTVDDKNNKYRGLYFDAIGDVQNQGLKLQLNRYISPGNAVQILNHLRLQCWGVDNWSVGAFAGVIQSPVLDLDIPEQFLQDYLDDLVGLFRGILEKGIENRTFIDFVDMLYLPVYYGLDMPYYQYFLSDEAQDFSRIMQRLLTQTDSRAHKTFVLDRNQSIYQWAGADVASVDNIANVFDTVSLPLSVCYRCPDQVLDLARKYVPHIEGTGKQGIVRRTDVSKVEDELQAGDLYISRTNAPLVKMYFKLLASGQQASIKGRNYAETMLGFIKLMEQADGLTLFDQAQDAFDRKVSKMQPDDTRLGMYSDVLDCIEVILDSQSIDTFGDLKYSINRMFTKDGCDNGVTLSSIHRSKGLENDRVFYFEGDRGVARPGRGQESNLAYVGITRAKQELIWVSP